MCKSFNSGPIRRRKTADLLLLKELLALVRLTQDSLQSFSRSLAARTRKKTAANDARRAESRPSGPIQQPSLLCRGRATTQRAKPQDSAAGGPSAHIQALARQATSREEFWGSREYAEQLSSLKPLRTKENKKKPWARPCRRPPPGTRTPACPRPRQEVAAEDGATGPAREGEGASRPSASSSEAGAAPTTSPKMI